MKIARILLLFSFLFTLASCTSVTEHISTIDAEEVLRLDPEADIFQHDNIIYKANIDWVEELTLNQGDEVAEITHQADDPDDFENGTANQLPVGTLIYSASGRSDILLADVDGELIPYLANVEG